VCVSVSLSAPEPLVRADAVASQRRLVDGVGAYLDRTGEIPTRLADVAREAGIGVATAYRHFADVDAVIDQFILRLPTAAAEQFTRRSKKSFSPAQSFNVWNRAWVDACLLYGVAATRLRSPIGFLKRRADGDPIVVFVCGIVEPLLAAVAAEGMGGSRRSDTVIELLWIWNALSDPREVLDQRHTRRRSPAQIARSISEATIAAGTTFGAARQCR
jgi:AcrR family transcriptional regulator